MKMQLKKEAIRLRKAGLSYAEILRNISISKSTLSLWLRSVSLSKTQKHRLTKKKLNSAKLGAQTRRNQRLAITKFIKEKSRLEIDAISKRELWLMGIMLYWAEGSKEKAYRSGQRVVFSNSDPLMIKLFLKWVTVCLGKTKEEIIFQVYVHEDQKYRANSIVKFWSETTGFPRVKFDKIYYKKNKISNRRKKSRNYYGLVRVIIKRSTNINRKIAGWIEGVCLRCGVV